MNHKLFLGLALCANILIGCKDDMDIMYVTHVQEHTYDGYELKWSDDFLGEGLPSTSSWECEEGYRRNSELQDYLNDVSAVRLDSGKLVLKAFPDSHDGKNPWTGEPYHFDYSSGSVVTNGKVSFERGRIDIAAKIPTGRGIWPSIRLLPATDNYPGQYAAVDIMEYVWGDDEKHSTVTSSLHTSLTENGVSKMTGNIQSATLDEQYHLYSLVWSKRKMELLFDNQVVYTCEKAVGATLEEWPFNQPFYLAISLAVGGTKGGNWGVDSSIFPAEMKIDYVRYYQLIGDEPDEEEGGNEEEFVPFEAVKNGGFEEAFAEGKEPAVVKDYDAMNPSLLNQVGRWFVKGPETDDTSLTINVSSDEGNSLIYNTNSVVNWWTAWLRYPMQNVKAGKYLLSFYAKSNRKEGSPFAACINFVKDGELTGMKVPDASDCIYIDASGTQSIISASGRKTLYPVIADVTNDQWKLYSVEVDIPDNQIVVLNFNIHSSWSYEKNSYTMKDKNPIQFWLDDVSLKTIDPSDE